MADSTRKTYLDVRPDAVRELFARVPRGPVVMLNLIRLREVADYAATPDLAPTELVSGAAAFDRYIAETLPVLRASGGDSRSLAPQRGLTPFARFGELPVMLLCVVLCALAWRRARAPAK